MRLCFESLWVLLAMNTCLAVQHISIYCLQSYLYNCLLHFSFFIQFSRYTLQRARRILQRYLYQLLSHDRTIAQVFGCLSRRSAGHHCSQSFPLLRYMPRRLPLLSLCFPLSTSAGVLCSQTIPFVRVLPPAQLVVGSMWTVHFRLSAPASSSSFRFPFV